MFGHWYIYLNCLHAEGPKNKNEPYMDRAVPVLPRVHCYLRRGKRALVHTRDVRLHSLELRRVTPAVTRNDLPLPRRPQRKRYLVVVFARPRALSGRRRRQMRRWTCVNSAAEFRRASPTRGDKGRVARASGVIYLSDYRYGIASQLTRLSAGATVRLERRAPRPTLLAKRRFPAPPPRDIVIRVRSRS